jgi:hypothetical protein
MNRIVFVILISFMAGTFMQAQSQGQPSSDFSVMFEESFEQTAGTVQHPFMLTEESSPGQKSRFLGSVYSLLLPGMGELYAGKFERGHIPLIAEGVLWLGLIGFNSYGGWIEDDARNFASQHSGANFSGKDDSYDVDIENYDDIYAYNNAKLINRNIDDLYPVDPSSGYYWKWDSAENREKFEDQRIKSDEMYNAVSFFVVGMIANRVWSAIKASLAVRDYNRELQTMSSLPEMRTRLTSYQGKPDGIQFEFNQTF